MARPPRTLAEFAVIGLRKSGLGPVRSVTKGAQVCGFLWALAYSAHKLGHWPTQAEYAAYWKISERNAQREWALFKKAFPDETSPERLGRWLLSEISARIEDSSAALVVPYPGDLALA